jgi:SAM-dependent methyltransferase
LRASERSRTRSPFDAFAWFYDRYWAAPYEEWHRPALDRLLLPHVPQGGRILDLCCGTGTLARRLCALGFEVTGVDSSEGMLQIAREHVPEGLFVKAEASRFALEQPVDAAVSLFDSLNHLLEPRQMQEALECVHAALRPGGGFVFDLNTVDAYGERWDQSFCRVEPDHAFFLRGGYDAEARIGHTLVTMFRLGEVWEREDVAMRQRPWAVAEVEAMLRDAGFEDVRWFRALEDLGLAGHYGIGRVFFRCSRSSRALGTS